MTVQQGQPMTVGGVAVEVFPATLGVLEDVLKLIRSKLLADAMRAGEDLPSEQQDRLIERAMIRGAKLHFADRDGKADEIVTGYMQGSEVFLHYLSACVKINGKPAPIQTVQEWFTDQAVRADLERVVRVVMTTTFQGSGAEAEGGEGTSNPQPDGTGPQPAD